MRGILASVFVRLDREMDPIEILKKRYDGEKFIRIRDKPVDVKSVAGTNFCDIFAKARGRDLYINSAIDNLMRGASSQAVVNANIMFGLSEGLGIPDIGYMP